MTAARWGGGHRVAADFDDGMTRTIDAGRLLWGPALEPLRDVGVFRRLVFDPERGAITWPEVEGDLDLSPSLWWTEPEAGEL